MEHENRPQAPTTRKLARVVAEALDRDPLDVAYPVSSVVADGRIVGYRAHLDESLLDDEGIALVESA